MDMTNAASSKRELVNLNEQKSDKLTRIIMITNIQYNLFVLPYCSCTKLSENKIDNAKILGV